MAVPRALRARLAAGVRELNRRDGAVLLDKFVMRRLPRHRSSREAKVAKGDAPFFDRDRLGEDAS